MIEIDACVHPCRLRDMRYEINQDRKEGRDSPLPYSSVVTTIAASTKILLFHYYIIPFLLSSSYYLLF